MLSVKVEFTPLARMVRAVARTALIAVTFLLGVGYLVQNVLTSTSRQSTVFVVTPVSNSAKTEPVVQQLIELPPCQCNRLMTG